MTGEPVLFKRLRDLAEVVGRLSDRMLVAEQRPMQPGPRGPSAIRLTGTLGNGVDDEFTINHNLSTEFVDVQLFKNDGTRSTIEADVDRPTNNTVTVAFAVPPLVNQFAYILTGPPA